MLRSLKNKTEGFTIIEVMIVLAIAALILVVVLIAVPQLQRNQRNAARRDILGRLKTEVDNYAGNNNGSIPQQSADTTFGFSGGFKTRYLSNISYNDPSTGQPETLNPKAANAAGVAGTAVGTVDYSTPAVCSGELAITSTNNRNYAIYGQLEGGATFCIDNH